jgi:hypothetical protein
MSRAAYFSVIPLLLDRETFWSERLFAEPGSDAKAINDDTE